MKGKVVTDSPKLSTSKLKGFNSNWTCLEYCSWQVLIVFV